MRRIAVIGGATGLGRRVVETLQSRAGVQQIRAIESRALRPPRTRRKDSAADAAAGFGAEADAKSHAEAHGETDVDVDVVPFVPDPRPLGEYLAKERIDTVVHASLVPDRCGLTAQARAADVIGAMCLGAAIGHAGSQVRSFVVASSSAVYPIGSDAALLQDEHQPFLPDSAEIAASIAEAEDYARETAHRLPHVNVAILRLQQLAGPGVSGSLARLLSRRPVPSPVGFDPAIQLLHVEDAVGALVHAVEQELAGLYNVASAGLIRFGEAVVATGRPAFPVPPLGVAALEPMLERLDLPFIPAELAALLRYGHALDTAKLERTGWRARHDQRACLAAIGGR